MWQEDTTYLDLDTSLLFLGKVSDFSSATPPLLLLPSLIPFFTIFAAILEAQNKERKRGEEKKRKKIEATFLCERVSNFFSARNMDFRYRTQAKEM